MSEKSDSEWFKALELVKQHAQQLGEHFETVEIMTTGHDDGDPQKSTRWEFGCGNYYARYGQACMWVKEQEEHVKVNTRKAADES